MHGQGIPGADPSTGEIAVGSTILRMVEKDLDRRNMDPKPAEFAIAGESIESTHVYHSKDGRTNGVWECTPGRTLDEQRVEDEFCTMPAGRVELIDNNTGTREIFEAGDSFFLARGSDLTWVIYETVRKLDRVVG